MSDRPSQLLRRIADGLEVRKGSINVTIPLPHTDLWISQLRQIADSLEDPTFSDCEACESNMERMRQRLAAADRVFTAFEAVSHEAAVMATYLELQHPETAAEITREFGIKFRTPEQIEADVARLQERVAQAPGLEFLAQKEGQ